MKRQFIGLLLLFSFSVFFNNLTAQNIIYEEHFDDTLNGWSPSLVGSPFWSWNTIAVLQVDTFRILSFSGGGAAILVDSTDEVNLSILKSDLIPIPGSQPLRLRFNQYLQKETSDTVYIFLKAGSETATVQFVTEDTSSLYNLVDIGIPSTLQGGENLEISFIAKTKKAVWIIDDIILYDSIPVTQPIAYIGDSLKHYNVPFDMDTTGWPYAPYQVVVDFALGTPENSRDSIRNKYGFQKIGSCGGEIELWMETGEDTNSRGIDILEKTGQTHSHSDVDGAELNIYNFNELYNGVPMPQEVLDSIPAGILPTHGKPVLIAILDTGIDYFHEDLQEHIWANPDGTSIYDNDYIGWNFVHNTNNPLDDNSHGTHVAGIIVQNMENGCGPVCDYKIVPLKTHNSHGVSNLFDVTCATYYGIEMGVDIINDSWGFYGTSSQILRWALEKADLADILVVTASGNDSLDLNKTPQYPASDDVENIVAVGSYDEIGVDGHFYKSPFSNYSSRLVDVLAPGDRILSTFPGNFWKKKSGTSMATPAVTAALAKHLCETSQRGMPVKTTFLASVRKEPVTVTRGVNAGKVLDTNCCPKFSLWKWCKDHWILLSSLLLILIIGYMVICWSRTKTLFRYHKTDH